MDICGFLGFPGDHMHAAMPVATAEEEGGGRREEGGERRGGEREGGGEEGRVGTH